MVSDMYGRERAGCPTRLGRAAVRSLDFRMRYPRRTIGFNRFFFICNDNTMIPPNQLVRSLGCQTRAYCFSRVAEADHGSLQSTYAMYAQPWLLPVAACGCLSPPRRSLLHVAMKPGTIMRVLTKSVPHSFSAHLSLRGLSNEIS